MKLNKPYTNKQYADFAVYCNRNRLDIVDKVDYLESVNPPDPTVEQKQTSVRSIRDKMLDDFEWRISRNNDERELRLTETDDRELLLKYREYLRNYPETDGWYEQSPNTFYEWKEDLNATEQIKTMGDVYGTVQSN